MSDIRVPYIEMRRVRWLAVALAVTAIGPTACGDDDGDGGGDAIRIETRLSVPVGEVLPGSYIGDSDSCRGGRFRDRRGGAGPVATVVKTFHCPNGRLTITFRPLGETSCTRQSSSWRIVNGSGRFEGLSGGGQMKAVFESKAGEGRETFTGTVTR